MISVSRLALGQGNRWRDAVAALVPDEDREGELLSLDEAEQSLADERCYLLVASLENNDVGLLSAFRFPDVECGGLIVYLYDIEVDPEHRQKGGGKQLVSNLIEHCDADEVDLIWAGTEADNEPARATFRATGGKLDSESYTEYEWLLEDGSY